MPAAAVWALVATLATRFAQVAAVDVVAFTLYVAGCLTLPGMVVWRWVDRRPGRPVPETLVLGTIVGYLLELPVYLLGRATGLPLAVAGWSVLVVVLALLTRRGRRLLFGDWGPPAPPAWSWSMAALLAIVSLWLARFLWVSIPLTPAGLRAPYADEPFHLALVGELRYHLPPEFPYVDGTPLLYHWLAYAHLASASWVSGIEPIVAVRVLGLVSAVFTVLLGLAVVTTRLTARWGLGLLAPALLALVAPVDVFGWTAASQSWAGRRYLSTLLFRSPTQTYAGVFLVLVVLLTVEILRRRRAGWALWTLTGLAMLALAGAKSTFLPQVLAGLAGALLLALVTDRPAARRLAGLAALAVAALLAARQLLYGPGTRGLVWDPFAALEDELAEIPALLDAQGSVAPGVVAVVAPVWVLAHLAGGIGVAGLLGRGGWRAPVTVLLTGTYAAGLGAALLLDHPGLGQMFFLNAVGPVLALVSCLGIARLLDQVDGRFPLPAGIAAGLAGAGIALAVAALPIPGPGEPAGSPVTTALRAYLVPAALAIVAVAGLVAVVWLVAHRRGLRAPGTVAALVAVCLVLGLGGLPHAAQLGSLANRPWTPYWILEPRVPEGGVDAARWLREHSRPDELVATNAHCGEGTGPRCGRRTFWISAFSERHVLVEGWAYVTPASFGAPPDDFASLGRSPFWDEERLAANDLVFTDPSESALRRLREEYGVDWLVADLRLEPDLDGLQEVAELVYRRGQVAVLRVPEGEGP